MATIRFNFTSIAHDLRRQFRTTPPLTRRLRRSANLRKARHWAKRKLVPGSRRFCLEVHEERLRAIVFITLCGALLGLGAQAWSTRHCAAVVFAAATPMVGAGDCSAPVVRGPFVLRTERQVESPLRLASGGNFAPPLPNDAIAISRHWLYQLPTALPEAEAVDELRPEHLALLCEVVRVGTPESFDVRIRTAAQHPDGAWQWLDLESGDAEGRILVVGPDGLGPQALWSARDDSATDEEGASDVAWLPRDYATISCPTTASAVGIAFQRLIPTLSRVHPQKYAALEASAEDFHETLRKLAQRLADAERTVRAPWQSSGLEVLGGPCQALAMICTAAGVLFLGIRWIAGRYFGGAHQRGSFIVLCLARIQRAGLIGTLLYLGLAMVSIEASSDPVVCALGLTKMKTMASLAFYTTLVSVLAVGLVDELEYLLAEQTEEAESSSPQPPVGVPSPLPAP
ncbi:MAG: hypothetical protein KDA61_05065 [Planctomycetales bacterium]|nr:hypothetical protein [Planctomycetales bacterium]